MPVLVYSPGIEVFIDSKKLGVIDVSDDIVRGRLLLAESRPHQFSVTLLNQRRRYDGLFMPNDRIVVRMKRLRWLQTFAGYLDQVPLFSVYSRSVTLGASCTLKRLQFMLWDPNTIAAEDLLHKDDSESAGFSDAGMKSKALRLLTEVAMWPKEHIHIAEVPTKWFETVSDLYDKLGDRIGTHQAALGAGATIAGKEVNSGPNTVEGVNTYTGILPSTSGLISTFGGPGGGAYGPFELTSEPGGIDDNARSAWGGPYYCAMRWPYKEDQGGKPAHVKMVASASEASAARNWWKNQRIIITNPANGKQCVVRPADWGPAKWTNKTIDVGRQVLAVLGTSTGHEVQIGFADPSTPCGPVGASAGGWGGGSLTKYRNAQSGSASPAAGSAPAPTAKGPTDAFGNPISGGSNAPLPKPMPASTTRVRGSDFAWGGYSNGNIPLDKLAVVKDPSGRNLTLHPLAAAAYSKMRDAALVDGIRLDITDSYRTYAGEVAVSQKKGDLAAPIGTSVHGWGFALDMAGGVNSFTSAGHAWMDKHGHEYGWVNPLWAQRGGSKPEPWHWEFWGALGIIPLPSGLPVINSSVAGAAGEAGSLFNMGQWTQTISGAEAEAQILAGPRALMNDEPFLNTVKMLMGASMRQFCTAPNGDFIGWFPDYFGRYGTAGKIVIQDIELLDFTVDWTDQFLKTHQFTSGASTGFSASGSIGGEDATAIWQKYSTTGIASVEFPEIMQALFGVTVDNDPYDFLNAAAFLQKHGARQDYEPMSSLSDPRAVFWYALHLFQQNWAEQFSAAVPMTFMPEAWPGMLLQIPTVAGSSVNFQAYIQSVTHDFDLRDGGGFQTQCTIAAPSIVGPAGPTPLPLVRSQ